MGIFLEFLLPSIIPVKKKILSLKFLTNPINMIKDDGVLKIISLMLPATIGIAVYQFNALVDTICASLLEEGSVSALYYSLRLTHLPLALFGISAATVLLPYLSEKVAREEKSGFFEIFEKGFYYTFLFILPAAIGIIYLSDEIVKVLFGRGEFDKDAILLTGGVLRFYASGLIFFSGTRLFVTSFYALRDTKTPVKTATFSLFVNIFLNVILMFPLKAKGLALATSISSLFNFVYLFMLFRLKTGYTITNKLIYKVLKIICCSLILFLFLYYSPFKSLNIYLKVFLDILVGFLVYIISCYFLGVLPVKS